MMWKAGSDVRLAAILRFLAEDRMRPSRTEIQKGDPRGFFGEKLRHDIGHHAALGDIDVL